MKKLSAAFDTETTGLLKPELTELHLQPHIIEIYICKFNDNFEIVDEFESYIKPPAPIDPEITKITGIENSDVKNAPKFIEIYEELSDFLFDVDSIYAHNCTFDSQMLANELKRIDKLLQFSWPKNHICTVEKSQPIENKRMSLGRLHKLATGSEIINAHRAKNDVLALVRCVKWLSEKGFL